jgi:class 3 adenylate cyclase
VQGERKQVTILFSDVVGFTAFSEKSGEEAAFELMRSLSRLMDDAVREHGGVVRNFTGDGIMAVFGAPVALEDAPQRACQAALSILRRLKTAGHALDAAHGVTPQLRIGLNTGPAVMGNVQNSADAGVTVLGDTVNVAARIQALAEPDSVYMSEATHRLVQGWVEANFAGEHQIKGKSEPQKVYRLEAIGQRTSRFDAAPSRGLTPYVGRDREVETLEERLAQTEAGIQVVDIVGEAGVGKSRLLNRISPTYRHIGWLHIFGQLLAAGSANAVSALYRSGPRVVWRGCRRRSSCGRAQARRRFETIGIGVGGEHRPAAESVGPQCIIVLLTGIGRGADRIPDP